MPRRFAPRNDRGGTSLHPQTRFCLLHVIANQCRGPRKGAPFAGRGAPRERCPALAFGRSWVWRTLGRRHGGLWGDKAWQSASPAQGVHCGNVLTNVATPPPSACHCEPVRTLVWQSASPQGNLARWYHFRQIRSSCVFAQSTTFRYVLPQEMRIATSLRSSQWHAETWQVPASAAM